MPDIHELISIDVPIAKVWPLVSTGEGLSKWWAEDAVSSPNGVDLGFFNRGTIYSLRLVLSTPTETEWLCQSGQEWKGTRLRFLLSETKGQTMLRFTHADWKAETEYFLSCNTTWGALMFRLKAVAEGKSTTPFFSRAGWML